ncbi:MAG: phenylalanine--tRNA ligase subunit beta [bacterium]|nr:phenylalanine--tRNA ligase subunit beta [bacterium]
MKVSVNWVREINRQYQCSADPMPKGIDDLVEKIGAQLGAVEEVIDLGKKYQGIVVAKVVSCEKHPNADKLSLCLIDDGKAVKKVKRNKDGLIEVVCGATNVAAGQLIAWIPPGATVPSTVDKEPFVLEAREIRGKISNGMIASAQELALGDDHTGILIIEDANFKNQTSKIKPGMPFTQVYQLDDYIIDIENKMFTHRPDCFGMLGIAREIAGIQGHVFKSPDWYQEKLSSPKPNGPATHELKVKNTIPKLVPRFCAVVLKDIKVGPSPLWLKVRLSSVGVKSINNIVDITNFLMLETAQPLHAYDYDKLSGSSIETRLANMNEELIVLGGKKIKLKEEDIVIASGGQAIGLGGVMGGAGSEVDASTKNITIEVANFDMNSVRRTAMTHGLFTDAATRFTKNQSSRQNLAVIVKVIDEVKKLAGGRQASLIIDDKHFIAKDIKLSLSAQFVNERLGLKLSAAQIKKILQNVEFAVQVSGEKLKIEAPFWRTDIDIAEDIVEEVGRLYGYDHLPLKLPGRDLAPAELNQRLAFKQQIREILSAAGANEVLTYSFVHSSLIEKAGQDLALAYHIKNALSPDLQHYRLSLTPSLLEKVHPNSKTGFDYFSLFEIGRAHVRGVLDSEKLPAELDRLALVFADKKDNKSRGTAFYLSKHYVLYLADRLGIGEFISVPLAEAVLSADWRQAAMAYEPARSAAVFSGQIFLGLVGEPSTGLRTSLKLPAYTAQAELDLAALALASFGAVYEPLNHYPALEQDITLKVPVNYSYAQVVDFISNTLDKASQSAGYQGSVGPLDIFQKPGDKKHKNITLRITMSHPERTLITEEVNKLLDKIAVEAGIKLKAERI